MRHVRHRIPQGQYVRPAGLQVAGISGHALPLVMPAVMCSTWELQLARLPRWLAQHLQSTMHSTPVIAACGAQGL